MTARRIFFILLGAAGLFWVYLFQDYLDFYSVFFQWEMPKFLDYNTSNFKNIETFSFIVNKAGRYLLNDLFSISIIYGIFYEKKYARFAFLVMIFGLLVLLPIYIFIYLKQPEGFSSMLSHLHRVVMNPVLMMLLIPAFFYQKRTGAKSNP